MSMLEDVMAEDDLFGDPMDLDPLEDTQNLNETIEGGVEEAEEVQDGAEAAKVEPKKRVIKNPQPKLNADRLRGPRGIKTMEKVFEDIKFKGKGHEKEYLDKVMWKLEHWCHRLYPKFQFDDCLSQIEHLGKKKVVRTYMDKVRSGMVESEDMPMEDGPVEDVLPPEDEFDDLLDQQIAQIRPAATPVPDITDKVKERIRKNQEAARERLKAKRLAQQLQFQEYEKLNNSTAVASTSQNNDIVQTDTQLKENENRNNSTGTAVASTSQNTDIVQTEIQVEEYEKRNNSTDTAVPSTSQNVDPASVQTETVEKPSDDLNVIESQHFDHEKQQTKPSVDETVEATSQVTIEATSGTSRETEEGIKSNPEANIETPCDTEEIN